MLSTSCIFTHTMDLCKLCCIEWYPYEIEQNVDVEGVRDETLC